ncbi:30S ribosomal protein S8e [Candidatus Woesearchaeota archaeon]|nr:30S ribosomal protein S8e [Candidatus Woesearchaeota archaeon]MCF7901209.1 30S ribosomal protein S8e [Candidatus Woesearchaeota archaeon]MCF8013696.1 30S ribosomal protein S8e [Candidatus Woesearchaeota archaeon]
MVIVQDRSLRKHTGGRNTSTRPRRVAQKGNNPVMTNVGAKRVRTNRSRGGSERAGLLSVDEINVLDSNTKKYSKAKLKNVKENSANRNYVRRNILTKGAIVETDKGTAKITSRPGQGKAVNAVLQ